MEFVTNDGATQLLVAENIKDGMVRYLETLGINQVGAGLNRHLSGRPLELGGV
jgi:hypothetical protein